MQTAARGLDLPDEQITRVIVGGLKTPIRAYVFQQNPTSFPDLFKHATLAETTVQPDLPAGSILQEIQSLRTEIQKIQTAASSNTAASIMPETGTGQPTHGFHQGPLRTQSVDAAKDRISIAQQHPDPELPSRHSATTVHPHRVRTQSNRDPQSKEDHARLVVSTPILGLCAGLKIWSASFVVERAYSRSLLQSKIQSKIGTFAYPAAAF